MDRFISWKSLYILIDNVIDKSCIKYVHVIYPGSEQPIFGMVSREYVIHVSACGYTKHHIHTAFGPGFPSQYIGLHGVVFALQFCVFCE